MSRVWIDIDESTFETEVLERSREVPVVVDFWAPWCGPCRTLGPILEELAAGAEGRWVLAKINSDEAPGLAQAYDIRGIPAVKAFVDGRVAAEFTGALPKREVEAFLDRIVPRESDRLARKALEAARRGDREGERAAWEEVLATEPRHGLALLQRARLRLGDGDVAAARADLEAVPEESGLHSEAQSLLRLAGWAERVAERGGSEAVRERAAANPENIAARYDFGCALAVSGNLEGALAEFLEVVRRDRSHEDDGGRKGMLAVFALLGDQHPVTKEYRDKLSAELF